MNVSLGNLPDPPSGAQVEDVSLLTPWQRMQLHFRRKFAGNGSLMHAPHHSNSQEGLYQAPDSRGGQLGTTTHSNSNGPNAASSSRLAQEAGTAPMRDKRSKIQPSIQVKRVKWGKPNPKALVLTTDC